MLVMAASSAKPAAGDVQTALKPLADAMQEVIAFRDSKRGHKQVRWSARVGDVDTFGVWVCVCVFVSGFYVS